MKAIIYGMIYCPKNKEEQDLDICLSCSNFNSIGEIEGKKAAINCSYSNFRGLSNLSKNDEGEIFTAISDNV